MNLISAEQEANYQYKQVDACEYYQHLDFDGTKAYESVLYQTDLGPRLPGSNASQELRTSITENLTEWAFEEDSHVRENFTLTNLIGKYSPENSTGDNVALGSQYDNEYVSHTIPRENDQVRWVRRIKDIDQSYFEQLDPSGDFYKSIEDLIKEGNPVGYLEVDQHGTEIGS